MKRTVKEYVKPQPLFEKGQKVYLDYGNGSEECVTVKSSTFQNMTRVFMYSFEEKGNLCVGECYLKENVDDEKLHWTDVIHHDGGFADNIYEGVIDGNMTAQGITNYAGNKDILFFRPDSKMLRWMKDYAAGRVILDVGCGRSAILCQSLHQIGQPVLGIEPFIDGDDLMGLHAANIERGKGIINILPKPVEECGNMITALGEKCLMVIARPCHSGFTENALDMRPPGMEALYITVPGNVKKYGDMGKWEEKAVRLKYDGYCADGEEVYSIK